MGMLTGVRVLDLSTVIAAPFAAGLMADFGAEVIKIEMPNGGDPFRRLGPFHGKDAMRFACMGRNKKSVTLDLRTEKGKEMFLKMVEKTDVVIENFRTGTLDKWGIGYAKMKEANKEVILSHVTGYGQTGPYAKLPGFGTPVTAFSGMTYITGYPDRPPVSPSFSLTDYIAGLYTCMGTMMALYHRDILHGNGQEVDVSLYESVFRFMEILCADYDKNGIIRERKPKLSGTSSPGGTYETKDHKWVVLVCSTDRTWEYLTTAMNREELRSNPHFNTMPVGIDAVKTLLPTPEQRAYIYRRLREVRAAKGGKPIFTIDFQNDGEFMGGCIAGGRNYLHINANGDVEPCVFIHYSQSNIKKDTLLNSLQQPLFLAYRDNQPFNNNHLLPCPMLENPEKLVQMVKETKAVSTDLQAPEEVVDLCEKCKEYAENWRPVANKLWAKNPHSTSYYENHFKKNKHELG